MSRCSGWLLNFSDGAQAVIGERELLHLMNQPQAYEVPCSPVYCRRVIVWEQGVLPVFDVGAWSRRQVVDIQDPTVAVVGFYPERDNSPTFGALLLASTPLRVDVDDAWACDLPEALERWRSISCACFDSGGRALPVLDLKRLFMLDLSAV
jgi:hypothetical protein